MSYGKESISDYPTRSTGNACGVCTVWLVSLAGITTLSVLADQNLDLPVHPRTHVTEAPAPLPEPPGDDPRDEPPPVFYGEEIDTESNSIVYVVDVSGSMGTTRLERAQQELTRSIVALSPSFRFDVVSYSCVLTTWRPQLVPANDSNKASAVAWVNALGSTGGTGTGPATALALRLDPNNLAVVLLTDGAPNCGAQGADGHRRMIRNANSQNATINVFGIDASGSYREFCLWVASDSGGSYFDVP